MADEPRVPNLTDLAALPRWAKVLFLSRCGLRVIPLIRNQWPTLSDEDVQQLFNACANADASAKSGRPVLVMADPLGRIAALIESAEEEGNFAGSGLCVCALVAGILELDKVDVINSKVAEAMELMVAAYAASGLEEGLLVGSVWFDYADLYDAAQANGWTDESPMPVDDPLCALWPNGTPLGWPDECN